MKYLWLTVSIFCISVLPCLGQPAVMKISKAQQEKAVTLAQKALVDLSQSARQVDLKSIGFENEKQVQEAKLGVPIGDYTVHLNELKEYRTGRPAAEMLHATGRLLFPVELNQKARSMVTLSLQQEVWAIESYGGQNQIQMITDLRKSIANSEGRPENELFQVRIPALQLAFIGVERGSEIYLSPLFDLTRHGLQKGKIYRAEEVLGKLIDEARQHNGLPT
jgi:hypothetical protein